MFYTVHCIVFSSSCCAVPDSTRSHAAVVPKHCVQTLREQLFVACGRRSCKTAVLQGLYDLASASVLPVSNVHPSLSGCMDRKRLQQLSAYVHGGCSGLNEATQLWPRRRARASQSSWSRSALFAKYFIEERNQASGRSRVFLHDEEQRHWRVVPEPPAGAAVTRPENWPQRLVQTLLLPADYPSAVSSDYDRFWRWNILRALA
jgi:hypothetical protein